MRFQVYDAENFRQAPCTDPARMNDWSIPDKIFPETSEEYASMTEVPYGIQVEALNARREAARQACYYECPMRARLLCLDEGLKPQNTAHNVMGGYTPNQRRAVVKALEERKVVRRKLARAMLATETREAPLNRV